MLELSVKVNNVYGEGVPSREMVRRAAEAGADAVGYWPWYDEDLDEVLEAVDDNGVELAYLSGGSEATEGPAFPLADPDRAEAAVSEIEEAIAVAGDAGADFLNVIPGHRDETLDPATQHLSVVRSLRRLSGSAAAAGVTLLVEPVNAVDHPGLYLRSSYEGYGIVDAVDSDSVDLLFDFYHQQITEGNLIANVREHTDLVGHVHVGDVPGRHEPGTGEINYPVVFDALAAAGYDGYVGCEFEPLASPEEAIRHVKSIL